MSITLDAVQMIHRPRRNRKSRAIRALVQETRLYLSDLIYPLFIVEGDAIKDPISSLPGVFRFSIDMLLREVEKTTELGIQALALFPVIEKSLKNLDGTESCNPNGVLPRAVRTLKKEFPHLCLISDVALDAYTSHGHDGLIDENGRVLNDETLKVLSQIALVQAEAGIDMVAPSDMMDGRVRAIRNALDSSGYHEINIHAYSAKFASSFYGPYRDALSSHLQQGDKKSYQMNPANQREALLEASLDEMEGADILMVKPALAYLDIIAKIKERTHLPISAFQVSGEYAMIIAAAQNGWLDGEKVLMEAMLCIKRAGADMIFTYAAPKVAELITTSALD